MQVKTLYAFVFVVLVGLLFYWFQVRPIFIRHFCDIVAWDQSKKQWTFDNQSKVYDWKYTQCLHSEGLK